MTVRSLPRIAITFFTLSILSCTLIACGASNDDDAEMEARARKTQREMAGEDTDEGETGTAAALETMKEDSATLDGRHQLASREGAFRITLPAGFEYPTESVSDMGKDVKLHKFVASNGGAEALMVTYTIVPDWFFKSGDTTGILDLLRDGDVVGATITNEREMRIGGHPGRSYFWSQRDQQGPHFGRSVHYLVPPRVYQITYLSSTGMKTVDTPENAKFFESFTLLPPEKISDR